MTANAECFTSLVYDSLPRIPAFFYDLVEHLAKSGKDHSLVFVRNFNGTITFPWDISAAASFGIAVFAGGARWRLSHATAARYRQQHARPTEESPLPTEEP